MREQKITSLEISVTQIVQALSVIVITGVASWFGSEFKDLVEKVDWTTSKIENVMLRVERLEKDHQQMEIRVTADEKIIRELELDSARRPQ